MLPAMALLACLAAPANLAPNGGLEQLTDGWFSDWSRGWARAGAEAFAADVSTDRPHSGERCLHFRHTGGQDWSINPGTPLTVKPGDILDLSVWIRMPGEGRVILCAWVHPPGTREQGVEWAAGAVVAPGPVPEWRQLKATVVVADGMATAQPRLIGDGPVEAFADDFVVTSRGNLSELRAAYRGPARAVLASRRLSVAVTAADGGLTVTVARTGRKWQAAGAGSVVPRSAERVGAGIALRVERVADGRELTLRFEVGR